MSEYILEKYELGNIIVMPVVRVNSLNIYK
jgi:hypothetical protein